MSDSIDPKYAKRTPRARDGDLQEGRPHPALRVYGANYGEAVSYDVARDRLAARKKGELPIIKGGLDDNDPSLEIKDVGLPGPYEASHLSNKPKPKRKQEPVPEAPSAGENQVPAPKSPIEELMEKVRVMEPGSVEALVDPVDDFKVPEPRKGKAKPRQSDGMKEVADALRQVVAGLAAMRPEAAPSPKTEAVNDNGSPPKAPRVRVEVATGQMTFNLPAIDYIRCAGGVAVMLPDSGDSMTFVPATGSTAVLACQERSARDEVVFTGISFHLKVMGALCLVFSYGRGKPEEDVEERRSPPKTRREGQVDVSGMSGMSVLDAVLAG